MSDLLSILSYLGIDVDAGALIDTVGQFLPYLQALTGFSS